jgi:hypothetical protein
MGLDMYLFAKEIDTSRELVVGGDEYCAITWRKANAIHKWFVKNVQGGVDDCGEYLVSPEKLKELSRLCKQCIDDVGKAEKLLPTSSGFFFGSTEYDEWYMEDLRDTSKKLDWALGEHPEKIYAFYYSSSW